MVSRNKTKETLAVPWDIAINRTYAVSDKVIIEKALEEERRKQWLRPGEVPEEAFLHSVT